MTDRLPLLRPVGKTASEFYDVLLSRGMVPGMTLAACRTLASEAEWDAYAVKVRVGREGSRAMRRLHDAPASPLWNPHAPETWDDPLAVDERENPLPGAGR